MDTALMTAQLGKSFHHLRNDPELWGRLIESVVGAHLLNAVRGKFIEVLYWREGAYEVDFVLKTESYLTGIELKSGLGPHKVSGLDKFCDQFKPQKILLIGDQGGDVKTFLSTPIETWVG